MSDLSRRSFLGALTAGAGLAQAKVLEGAVGKPVQPGSRAAGKPKNVLLLMSDQHTPTALGVNGDSVAHTPNLDALAESAVRFESAYCTNPVCLPSRASLLTGLYTHHNGCYSNETPWPYEHKTLAHYFHDAGYMTSLIGKMHFDDGQTHGFDYHLDFNEWFQYLGPKTKIWADELGHPNNGAGQPQIPELWGKHDPWAGVRTPDHREGSVAVGRVSDLAEEDHFESFVARETIRFLETYGKSRPFFLISSFLKPHDPFMPARRFAEMYDPARMKVPETWGKVDLSTVPRIIRKAIEGPGSTPELRNPEAVKTRIAMYYAQLAQMDDCLGKVLAVLRELGLEDDTIILYTADHGDMLGRHGLWDKFVFYEPSVGVPLICRVPGLTPENVQCQTPVSQVQVVATLTELCGLPLPPELDAASFTASLQHPSRTLETSVFAEFATHSRHPRFMIRRGDFKYCYYVNDLPELYHLSTDPQEMKNLALLPEYQEKVKEMKQRLFAWHRP
ncbi:MAG TPA: sulfatase-like hydrolase/transferase [Terriglobia bacterium]|nr:sulfatase-like hydrolase/transferase [Terriglobia bacterium]